MEDAKYIVAKHTGGRAAFYSILPQYAMYKAESILDEKPKDFITAMRVIERKAKSFKVFNTKEEAETYIHTDDQLHVYFSLTGWMN